MEKSHRRDRRNPFKNRDARSSGPGQIAETWRPHEAAATEVETLTEAVNGFLDPLLDQDEATVAWRRAWPGAPLGP